MGTWVEVGCKVVKQLTEETGRAGKSKQLKECILYKNCQLDAKK